MAYVIFKLIQTVHNLEDVFDIAHRYNLLHCFVAKMAVEFGQLDPDRIPWHKLWEMDQEQLNAK